MERRTAGRGATEVFGSGPRQCLTNMMDSFHPSCILGAYLSMLWPEFVSPHGRYSMDFFDDDHQVVVRPLQTSVSSFFLTCLKVGWFLCNHTAIGRASHSEELVSAQISLPMGWCTYRIRSLSLQTSLFMCSTIDLRNTSLLWFFASECTL